MVPAMYRQRRTHSFCATFETNKRRQSCRLAQNPCLFFSKILFRIVYSQASYSPWPDQPFVFTQRGFSIFKRCSRQHCRYRLPKGFFKVSEVLPLHAVNRCAGVMLIMPLQRSFLVFHSNWLYEKHEVFILFFHKSSSM
jgi:hypothetical protein